MPAFFMRYIEVYIQNIRADLKEILIAFLPDFGFNQMEESETEIKAYAPEGDSDLEDLKLDLLFIQPLSQII